MRQGAQASGHTKPGFDGANIEGVYHPLAEAPEQLDILNLGLFLILASASSPQVFKSVWDFTIKFELAVPLN